MIRRDFFRRMVQEWPNSSWREGLRWWRAGAAASGCCLGEAGWYSGLGWKLGLGEAIGFGGR